MSHGFLTCRCNSGIFGMGPTPVSTVRAIEGGFDDGGGMVSVGGDGRIDGEGVGR